MKEAEDLTDFITSHWQKDVIPPVLDGLFGGKACYRSWADKSKPTTLHWPRFINYFQLDISRTNDSEEK